MSWYGPDPTPRYDTLYGKELNPQELEAYARNDVWMRHVFEHEENARLEQPWHVGWKVSRNGGTDMSGEWMPSDSWLCKKIVRPSYREDLTVKLVVHVGGRRTGSTRSGFLGWSGGFGKLRAHHWYASLEFADTYSSFVDGWRGSCKSLADAMRKADRLDIGSRVAELLKAYYSPKATAIFQFRQGVFEPWSSWFGRYVSMMELPVGEYMELRWEVPYKGPVKLWRTFATCTGGSACSGGTRSHYDERGRQRQLTEAETAALVANCECWLPRPKEEAVA